MNKATAPDLGYVFQPSRQRLAQLAKEKSKVIIEALEKNNFSLVLPHQADLPYYLAKRMREQGRFAALKIKKNGQIFFIKFPLGGKSAQKIALREAFMFQLINKLKHGITAPTNVKTIKTPYGFGLIAPFYEGVRLQHQKKSDKIAKIADLLFSLQTLLDKTNFSTALVTDPMIYNTMTHPIHSFEKYKKEVFDRAKILTNDLSRRILTNVNKMAPAIKKFQGVPVFSHRDFFDKNIIVPSSVFRPLILVDFEHSAIIKNYILGLNFDLANIVVQWYRYPQINKKLINLVRKKNKNKMIFDLSLRACLIIQILAKIDPIAQKMHPGGVKENIDMMKQILYD